MKADIFSRLKVVIHKVNTTPDYGGNYCLLIGLYHFTDHLKL